MDNLISAKFETEDLLASLAGFEKRIVENVLFTGSATMAKVLYDEVKLNVGQLGIKTGNLNDAIYWAHSPEESTPERKVYKVSWNKKKAPHGGLVEFGHRMPYVVVRLRNGDYITRKTIPLTPPKQVPPHPFIRPAFAQMGQAIQDGMTNMTIRFSKEAGL